MDLQTLKQTTTQHVTGLMREVFTLLPQTKALLVYDAQCDLSRLLAEAYRQALPQAHALLFDGCDAATVMAQIAALTAGDLVILVQSTSFRLDEFRIRVHLFEQGLQVIEHPHLARLKPEEAAIYIESLAYDAAYYRRVGPALKKKLETASSVRVSGLGHELVFNGPFETPKLNIGLYEGMKNKGGQFPIGEVFTELRDLKNLSGKTALFAFGDRDFRVRACDPPIIVSITQGRITGVENTCAEFTAVLADIKNHEGEIWVRELGFGLNRAMTAVRRVGDVGIYERMCGIHLSLGAKHALYPKEGFHKKKVKFHVDVFAVADNAAIDGEVVYQKYHYVL